MASITIASFILGLGLLILGYRKNHRNLLLVAAMVPWLSGVLEPFVEGFVDGFQANTVLRSGPAR